VRGGVVALRVGGGLARECDARELEEIGEEEEEEEEAEEEESI